MSRFFWGLLVPPVLRRLAPRWLLDPPLVAAARHPWISLAALVFALVIGGALAAASGVVPITASEGHWQITERFLQFSKRRSVTTHALVISTPPLDDERMVMRGAGHYDLGCLPCHGGPDGEVPQLPRYMLPPPPHLDARVTTWRPRELFYIVKHGIKMTGMPAWAAQERDDEVWSMVAFLRRLPGMDRAEYRRLARNESDEPTDPFALVANLAPPPPVVLETCARCHGADGLGRGGAFPKLAGQRADYLDRALGAYADRRRHSGVMGPIAAALTPDARARAVAYYASLQAPGPAAAFDAQAARGARIATEGDGASMIPACIECHGDAGTEKNPAYPILHGQYADYLALQLRLLRDRQRGGSDYVHLMHSFAGNLTDDHVRDAAAWFAATGN